MNYLEWQESLKIINCMNLEKFKECFGRDGEYLFSKFCEELNRDVFKFVCYLDMSNAKKMHTYCMSKMGNRYAELILRYEKDLT